MALNECCREPVLGTSLVLRDRGGGKASFRMRIPPNEVSNVRAYKVDGCQIKEGMRCDFLVLPNEDAAVLIELKGGDVEKGIAQLSASIKSLEPDISGRRRFAVLVPTRCPLPPYQVQKALDTFRRSLRCRLKIDNIAHNCCTSDF